MADSKRYRRNLFYILFAVSGFSGLIYESIWSHYLKLFLGHAAYAQTLVLTIFMGGMAIGSWLASRYSVRWKNLLVAYALTEGVIGVCGLVFHNVFVGTIDLAYTVVIPALGSPWSVDLFKWCLAGVFILPQSILLGATFPLMTAGLVRRFPAESGASIATLYFTNSFGAAIGVLASGFVLIELVGLPGTILTAGLINILLALLVWLLARHTTEKAAPTVPRRVSADATGSWRLLLAVSLFTGAASFMYEIGWIRMLSLVLGSSTHAFELMLGAFIFGLAFGGLWIRRRIDSLKQPVRFLGLVQIVMGLFALATLIAYNASFNLMREIMDALAPTAGGYRLFSIGSHTIALGIMLPATFCAGMTLPLITNVLLRSRHGEKSIGMVYAANTVGAIAGIFFAVHFGLPIMGVKGVIITGAVLDMALGIVLLRAALVGSRLWLVPGIAILASMAVVVTVLGVELDRYKMASGVYRHGGLFRPGDVELLYHKDGKTATVDLVKYQDGNVSVRTNGKPDAMINLSTNGPPAPDEVTMIMSAVTPLMLHPQARTVANIGLGSGLTAHVLLGASGLERVDTIEIEPAMVEAAHGFGSRVERTFLDPRSHIYIDDAKSFFAARGGQYDIIVSEPSNPWVSGVSGLFSGEFYQRIRTHLNPGGLFVQWFQLYEINTDLVASVMKAIGANFTDYVLYAADDSDLLIVARWDGRLSPPDTAVLAETKLAEDLRRIGMFTRLDLELRRIGGRALFEPLFASFPIPANSDFFPVLDLYAERVRFTRSMAVELVQLGMAPLPVLEMLEKTVPAIDVKNTKPTPGFARTQSAKRAVAVLNFYRYGTLPPPSQGEFDANLAQHLVVTQQLGKYCRDVSAPALWLDSVYNIAITSLSQLPPDETQVLWQHWRSSDCYRRLSSGQADSLALFHAVGRRDAEGMAAVAEKLLANLTGISGEQGNYLLGAGMLGYLAQGRPQNARRLWMAFAPQILSNRVPGLMLRVLKAKAFSELAG